MPELPEVETIRRSLEPLLLNQQIRQAHLYLAKAFKTGTAEEFSQVLAGAEIRQLLRRGKHLIIRFEQGMDLVVHLRMTGRLLYVDNEVQLPKHTTACWELTNGKKLVFEDTRKFGTLHLVPAGEWEAVSSLKDIGVEPLGAYFTFDYFYQGLQRKTKIKVLLLDQTFIAGLGNIYVDESLFQAGIHPERPADSLSKPEAKRLHQAIRQTVELGVKHRGTSISDYLDGLGHPGEFQNFLAVYQRTAELCPKCETPIARIKIGGRSSHFCPNCQRPSD